MGTSIFVKADLSMKKYLRRILLPSIILTVVLVIATSVLVRFVSLPTGFKVLLYLIPLVVMIYAAFYPYFVADSKKISINSKIPFFITYFATLSTSEVSRDELIKILSENDKLGAIASELKKVYTIVGKLHRSLPEAFRFLARRTPSKVFADFLDRLAYSLDSGVELKDYLFQEQTTVMDDFQTFYEGALYDLDVFKEIYESIIISVVFIASFIIIGPIITGQSIARLSIYLVAIILASELGILFFIRYRMPEDPVWAEKQIPTERTRKLRRALRISILGTVVMGLIYVLLLRNRFNIPYQFVIALVSTPLAYAGWLTKREEESIYVMDENFPAFIRSLSSTLAASGSSMVSVLKYLSAHDFGSLTERIRALYKRLAVRINDEAAWDYFIAETGSWLIGMFSEMFRESIKLGAEPDYVGKVISRNFERMVRMRRKRSQSVASFIGVIYGLTGAFAFTLASSFQVAVSIGEIFGKMEVPSEYIGSLIHVIEPAGLVLLTAMMLLLMVIHSLISSLVIKFSDGGNLLATLYYFVILIWIFAVGMYFGQMLMAKMLKFGASEVFLLVLKGGSVP
ncbi:flagellar assembly protein FlaJ [Thermococcus sp. P6]|uniref:archaellar assembly protein FlaJ n=1 Tax=Thermococcus sp. P6 TaxID=122420 RepID=UPI000B5992CE|nr:archaellar assembly protein FlaJ [Thermococcus sp. P6]ASJ11157.1 flagellar assembly protein FlaJ [Thermococcus sp. P6]